MENSKLVVIMSAIMVMLAVMDMVVITMVMVMVDHCSRW